MYTQGLLKKGTVSVPFLGFLTLEVETPRVTIYFPLPL